MQTVIEKLVENGALLRQEKYIHKYPYDWRTKKPVIQLATEQWFINLEQLKDQALQNIDDVEITPSSGNFLVKFCLLTY
jgi:isoleucyl-tRNA synthetase